MSLTAPACLFDVNLWLALTFSSHPQRALAEQAYAHATRSAPACFCRTTQQSYLRLVTNATLMRAFGSPAIGNVKALSLLNAFRSQPEVSFREEPDGLESIWHRLAVLDGDRAAPKVWMDAYLAAFTMSADLSLATLDHDFVKYRRHGLKLLLLET